MVKKLITVLLLFFFYSDQSVGGAKWEIPREKTPDTPVSRTWLDPHAQCATQTHTRHRDENINLYTIMKTTSCNI